MKTNYVKGDYNYCTSLGNKNMAEGRITLLTYQPILFLSLQKKLST